MLLQQRSKIDGTMTTLAPEAEGFCGQRVDVGRVPCNDRVIGIAALTMACALIDSNVSRSESATPEAVRESRCPAASCDAAGWRRNRDLRIPSGAYLSRYPIGARIWQHIGAGKARWEIGEVLLAKYKGFEQPTQGASRVFAARIS